MNIDLIGKRAIITGGSRGIGRAIALAFAEAGALVSICARGADGAGSRPRRRSRRTGATAHVLATCDLADAEAVARYIAQAAEALGGVDILVNNASGFGSSDDEEGWAKSLSVDLMATVRATPGGDAVPRWRRKGPARSSTSSSTSAFHPRCARRPHTGVAKSAVIQYTLQPRQRRGFGVARRIRVNCVAPGSIEFPGGGWERRKIRQPTASTIRSCAASRLAGLAHCPEEVAKVAAFLVSPLASAGLPARSIMVDGGQLDARPLRPVPSDIQKRRLVLALQDEVESIDAA